jgi:C4-dicarboxylate-specific signal transduction histidine kinase
MSPPRGGFLREAHSQQRVAAWREAYLYGILIAAVFLPFDFLYPERLAWTLGARAALVATLVGCRWRLGTAPRTATGRVALTGALAAALLTPVVVVTSAGGTGPRFGFLLSVPFILLSLLPEVPHVAAFAGLFAALVGGGVLVSERQPAALVVEWTILASVVTAATAVGARRVRLIAARADEAEREHDEVVAELERSEQRRAASERFALVGRLAAGIGHEINNPLSAVKGNLSCALEELERGDVAPHAREALVEALAATERIAWTTADMRALANDAGAPLVSCAVDDAIRDGIARASPRLRGVKVLVDLEPGLPLVLSEPRLLSDAVAQLAAQAASARGTAGEGGGAPTVRVGARRVGGGIEITIDDEGPRIPAHVLPAVFEPFAAQGEVRGGGLGLSLPLTRELAERSGGRVEARWHEGGNRYAVTLATSGE